MSAKSVFDPYSVKRDENEDGERVWNVWKDDGRWGHVVSEHDSRSEAFKAIDRLLDADEKQTGMAP